MPFFPKLPWNPNKKTLPFPDLTKRIVESSFFFDSTTKHHLEVELCPSSSHLLELSGGERWMAEALLPWPYFPPSANKMNSYAIHGSGEKLTYEGLCSIPKEEIVEGQKPNFHRLEDFQDFRLQSIMGETSQNLLCGRESLEVFRRTPSLSLFISVSRTHRHTNSPEGQQGNSANSL
uniref:Uncharacterized protein n=1 Tax=Stegastes partitus TaxID=144197 RepID=A0A3B5ARW5_9TELE